MISDTANSITTTTTPNKVVLLHRRHPSKVQGGSHGPTWQHIRSHRLPCNTLWPLPKQSLPSTKIAGHGRYHVRAATVPTLQQRGARERADSRSRWLGRYRHWAVTKSLAIEFLPVATERKTPTPPSPPTVVARRANE